MIHYVLKGVVMITERASAVRTYRDLRVWQEAISLVPAVYEAIKALPIEERYELASQIRRAVVSIPANIAEGQARRHTKEFLQALYIARGSLAELETLLIVSERLGYLTPAQMQSLEEALMTVRQPLLGLIRRLRI
jgi:four helix bundle protein